MSSDTAYCSFIFALTHIYTRILMYQYHFSFRSIIYALTRTAVRIVLVFPLRTRVVFKNMKCISIATMKNYKCGTQLVHDTTLYTSGGRLCKVNISTKRIARAVMYNIIYKVQLRLLNGDGYSLKYRTSERSKCSGEYNEGCASYDDSTRAP